MSTVLITGVAGFIGSHTADHLLAAGHRVVGVDNFRTGKRANIALALKSSRFKFHRLDVTNAAALDALIAKTHPDTIIHLAALVSVQESISHPALNFELNVAATQNVAESARRRGVRRIVFASSAAVYGNSPRTVHESSPTRPLSPYGAAKRASEEILLGYAATFGLIVRCQRYFNVYGPRQDPHSPYSGVLSVFLDRLRAGKTPEIFGDGGQTRDFIAVGDVARANVLAATRRGISSGIANICTGRSTSINQLTNLLARQFKATPPPRHTAARAGDIRFSRGNPEKARADFGFSARIKIRDGLAALSS